MVWSTYYTYRHSQNFHAKVAMKLCIGFMSACFIVKNQKIAIACVAFQSISEKWKFDELRLVVKAEGVV